MLYDCHCVCKRIHVEMGSKLLKLCVMGTAWGEYNDQYLSLRIGQ